MMYRCMQMSYEAKMVQRDFQFLCFLKTIALYYLINQLQFPLVCLQVNEIHKIPCCNFLKIYFQAATG